MSQPAKRKSSRGKASAKAKTKKSKSARAARRPFAPTQTDSPDQSRDQSRDNPRGQSANKSRSQRAEKSAGQRRSRPTRGQPFEGGFRGRARGARAGEVVGLIKRHPDGFGFLVPEVEGLPDIYVPKHGMLGAMTNDRVRARYQPEANGERLRGEIVEILERRTKQVVGCYQRVNELYGLLLDQSYGWGGNIKIWSSHSLAARDRDYVLVEITGYPGNGGDFQGRVVEIIGDIEDPLNDVRRVVLGQGLPHEFSAQALADANQYGQQVGDHDLIGRRDLRALRFITIDGVTAKDFDDAVYCERTTSGFRLWVAIADVSHYVKPNTALDDEAYERGNSTYFPNFVVPMLPENLSNELCSLRPHVLRLAMVAEMTYDFQGQMQSSQFYEAVIQSHKRVTYGEAQEILDGSTPENMSDIEDEVRCAADLAKIFMAKRLREGSLDLDISETQVEVDERGEPVDIIRSERLFAHRLIEELMLAANVAVAEFLTASSLPALYRVHEPPNEEDVTKLERYLYNLAGVQELGTGSLQKKLNRTLSQFANTPQEEILNILTLRMMNQAQYSARNVGHFGLAFADYTHFTSPIRRYADLIVHRLLKHLLVDAQRYPALSEERLAQAGTLLSACEQRSVKAERQLISIKKARFMAQYQGETFAGVISSVTKFGFFVLLREFDVDGLVHVEDLSSDYYVFDDENLRLMGKRTGKIYSLGDTLEVTVAAVDTEAGKVDFIPLRDPQGGAQSRQRPKRSKKR